VTAPTPATGEAAPRPVATGRRGGPSRLPGIALAALLVLAVAAFVLLTRPRLVFTNTLAQPVRLALDGDPAVTVAPGSAVTLPLGRGATVVAEWATVPPTLTSGAVLGERLRGTVAVRGARGRIAAEARPILGDTAYFAPVLTNRTGVPLDVRVNAGLEGARDCCVLPAGAERARVGYWRLWRNSTVEVRDSAGRRAIFRDLGPQITSPDGTIRLRFNPPDLR
jgi:hypothetical protein